jgi:squalene-hopene/tetraprenyl-beta-curcumene cyclase
MTLPNALKEWQPRSFGRPMEVALPPEPEFPALERVERGALAARKLLLSRQKPDGHWCAELEGDTILESEYVLLQAFLGRLGSTKIGKCARYMLERQLPTGGWAIYPGGPAEISATVKAYFALKLAGHSADSEPMRRARLAILDLGGAERCNSYTRFALASLGQIPYGHCPTVPPELLLVPNWFPVSLYRMSAWTRSIVVPLAIFSAKKPVTKLPADLGVAELFRNPPTESNIPSVARIQGRLFSWDNLFRALDRGLKLYERWCPGLARPRALKAAERWMLEHFEGSDGVGAIFPPMVYTIVALKCLGYAEDSPEFRWAETKLEELLIEEPDTIRIQPCVSPVWDTAWSMIACADAGLSADDPALRQGADWLLAKEIRVRGDWTVMNPTLEPSGWAFEYANQFYPDLDDTAAVLMALRKSARYLDEDCQSAVHRAVCFLQGMQGKDGGWAAFDRDIDNAVLERVPFADHNAMLDPSCPDITARVLEMFGQLGYARGPAFLERGIEQVLAHQEPEGCWFGRWGVNYIYGTWQVLVGLAGIGYDRHHPRVRKAVDWLLSVQQADGGWGETCATYDDRSLMGTGEPTPSQTAWAILGLMAAGEGRSPAVRRGVEWLLDRQRPDGGWDETVCTGTGFPKVFYLRYHDYCLYFPLMALGRYLSQRRTATAT